MAGRRRVARARRLTAAALAVLLLGACGTRSPEERPQPTSAPATTEPGPTAVPSPAPARVVASGLDVPWGLAFLPDGSALVTLRNRGEVLQIREGQPPRSLGRVAGVAAQGEGGLLGVAVSPGFARDGAVFVYLTAADDNRVVRLHLAGGVPTPEAVIVEGIPRAGNHNGGRLAFGPDGYLYIATGDAGEPSRAQDTGSLGGKILRVDADGRPAPGNPFGNRVWSLGHRNVQGMAWDADGRMFASEFGQDTWDELNLIEPGANYGWPEVEGNGGPARFTDPLVQWPTDDASPSGIAVADGAVYLAALRGESLWRVPLVPGGDVVGKPERLLEGTYGRLRTVVTDDAGDLWVVTSNTFRGDPRPGDDRVVVLDPAALG
ncbi:sorbosone dehydrogenase family protein [Georgenia sp. SYP-B2076]|uniref:PQQ-dependent sugar dehydrogenase n=1 Tax=Georgenia sp. SYP-B2076 TaxID=2495881 RepID=UPI000F8C8F80|nr:PQQ-dependent sugar dehydrogenase [Georgenia sp. SYP-B2076]